nr:hypothetical protein [Brucella anthropi]
MIDIPTIAELIGLVKGGATAVDAIAQTTKSIKAGFQKPKPTDSTDIAPINDGLNEILDQTIALKQLQLNLLEALIALKDEKLTIEAERAAFEDFKEISAQYELKEILPNSYVRVRKAESAPNGNARFLCAPCFTKKKIGMLQVKDEFFGHDIVECTECSSTARVPNNVKYEVRTSTNRGRDFFDV